MIGPDYRYPPPGYYYQQSPRKRPVWPWVLGTVFLLVFLGFAACFAFVGGVANNINKESQRQVTVTYEVEGSGSSVAVTYSRSDFNTAQDTDVTLPWTKQITISGFLKTVSLIATNGHSDGTVTCRILADGNVIAQQTSSGPFATASCIGNAGQK
jgi:hypothetical protein